jgi:hypothetical protein
LRQRANARWLHPGYEPGSRRAIKPQAAVFERFQKTASWKRSKQLKLRAILFDAGRSEHYFKPSTKLEELT